MQQLTEQEQKRIQRYCTYPKIAATALVMSFVACLLMLPLQMINDIAFHQKEFQPAGIYTAIALTVIELAIFCYCAFAPRFGMQGKQWKELQSRLAVAQTNKDRSTEVAGVLATQAAGRLLKNSDNDLARNLAVPPRSPAPWGQSPRRQTCWPRPRAMPRPWQTHAA